MIDVGSLVFWYAPGSLSVQQRLWLISFLFEWSTINLACFMNSAVNIQNHIWPSWKYSKEVLIWSGLTRKFHQRFMKRIISTCTFKPPPTQLENCWHTSICEEFRLAILLEYIQTPLWTAPPVLCTHNLLFTFDVCPNVCFVNLYCCLYLHYFWNYNLVLE